MLTITKIKKAITNLANLERAEACRRYFKTAKGEYGYGDVFIGVTVPELRKVAKKFAGLDLKEIDLLIKNKIHEYRFVALQILVLKYKEGDDRLKKKIISYYFKNKKYINNWDLVDTSAPYILGDWLVNKDKSVLLKLSKSKNLWDKRIAILATFAFIRKNDFEYSFNFATSLMTDKHDLIHKALGWMLREIGKRSEQELKDFLEKNCHKMPRTMLRYAIERFDKDYRKMILAK